MVSKSKTLDTLIWTLSAVVMVEMALVGGQKIMGQLDWVRNFSMWGYPNWFMILVGWTELLGAITLCIKPTAAVGSGLLTATMLGATVTQFIFNGPASALIPFANLIACFSIFLYRWPTVMQSTPTEAIPVDDDDHLDDEYEDEPTEKPVLTK